METLSQKQQRFAHSLALLVIKMIAEGYHVTFGEVKRSDEQAWVNAIGSQGREAVARLALEVGFKGLAEALRNNGKNNGVVNSVHQLQLAADLNLFKDGVYLSDSESHRRFGEWWEQLGADFRWGGRFKDGNHYSIEHNGVK